MKLSQRVLYLTGIGVAAFNLIGCGWRDCDAPYFEGFIFQSSEDIEIGEDESEVVIFEFYPEKPYRLEFDNQGANRVSIYTSAHGPFETIFIPSRKLTAPSNGYAKDIKPGRLLYGPDDRLEFRIKVTPKL